MSNTKMFDLTGKKALVTGAAVGIGRGYATALAQAGADVAIVDMDAKTGPKTAAAIKEKYGVDSFFIPCNVTKKEDVDAMMAAVIERFGHLDIGVNNAGIAILGADEDYDIAAWNKVVAVNFTGMYLCAQAEGKQFIKQKSGGKIINTASMSARICNCNVSYDATKGAVVEMTRTLAANWGQYNINVNCVSPSYIFSPMHASTPLEVRARIRELTPLGHLERPEDLYGPVVFLASDASNYVTGVDLLVDGGHTLNNWLVPMTRAFPPRVSPDEEIVQLKYDLKALELEFDENGINEDLHPEIANAYKAAFGL